ncbi:MAG: deoxyhypusine synthase family protein [Candidatus Micrarchaeota archaeon]
MVEVKGLKLTDSASDLVTQMRFTGLQATELGKAVEVVKQMKKDKAFTVLTFTSNMASSGLREVFADLCKRKFIDCIITGIGSVEEDLMKSNAPFDLGSFDSDDAALHQQGTNRIGNILVTNDHYEWLETQLKPFFKDMLALQKKQNRMLSPSELIHHLGLTINDSNSFIYQAAKNNIPVFCPAPTDGAFGLQLFFFKQDHPEFGIDVTADMKQLHNLVMTADKTGGIILGGGFAKHHAIGANILRGGFDYAVYISTGSDRDGSLSGARTKEAVSWGKIKASKPNAPPNTAFVECDASIAFPLLLAGVL